jgi:putative membrane protein
MILGAWCGQLGVGGWVLMGLFWATFVGLMLWALSRLFAPVRKDDVLHENADDLDQRWAREQMDLSDYQSPRGDRLTGSALHEELTASTRARNGRTR